MEVTETGKQPPEERLLATNEQWHERDSKLLLQMEAGRRIQSVREYRFLEGRPGSWDPLMCCRLWRCLDPLSCRGSSVPPEARDIHSLWTSDPSFYNEDSHFHFMKLEVKSDKTCGWLEGLSKLTFFFIYWKQLEWEWFPIWYFWH